MTRTRRAFLRALATGGLSLSSIGCLVPKRTPPAIAADRPLAPIARPRHSGLWVGAASIDVTPPVPSATYLAGFGFQRRAKDVRDRLFARCLYLDDGLHRVALVVADVVGLLAPTIGRVRRLVGPGIDVAVIATHNHQGPDTMGYWGPAILYALPHRSGIDPGYLRVFERRLAAAVGHAAHTARPARLAFARAEVPAGLVRNLRSPGFIDPGVEVIEATGEDGAVIATFVDFACHPETLGDRARRLSADFPGRLRARLDERRGGTSVFANGALGGMVTPALDDDLDEPARGRVLDHLGDELARVAAEAIAKAPRLEVGEVRYVRRRLELPTDNALFHYVDEHGIVEPRDRGKNGGFVTEVGRIDLGPASLALVPGEPTPKVGLRIKHDLGVEHPIVVGLANDELGYVLDPAEFEDPGFDYERTVSMGPKTAPLVEGALRAIARR